MYLLNIVFILYQTKYNVAKIGGKPTYVTPVMKQNPNLLYFGMSKTVAIF